MAVQTHPTALALVPGALAYVVMRRRSLLMNRWLYVAALAFVLVNLNLLVYNLSTEFESVSRGIHRDACCESWDVAAGEGKVHFSNAPISTTVMPLRLPSLQEAGTALVGRGDDDIVAEVDGPASREKCVSLGPAAIVGERAQFGVDGVGGRPNDVAVDAVGEAGAAGAVADQVVAAAGEAAGHVRADAGEIDQVRRDDRVADAEMPGQEDPPPMWAMLSATVQLRACAVGCRSPAALRATLPLTVPLVSVGFQAKMPPPSPRRSCR